MQSKSQIQAFIDSKLATGWRLDTGDCNYGTIIHSPRPFGCNVTVTVAVFGGRRVRSLTSKNPTVLKGLQNAIRLSAGL